MGTLVVGGILICDRSTDHPSDRQETKKAVNLHVAETAAIAVDATDTDYM